MCKYHEINTRHYTWLRNRTSLPTSCEMSTKTFSSDINQDVSILRSRSEHRLFPLNVWESGGQCESWASHTHISLEHIETVRLTQEIRVMLPPVFALSKHVTTFNFPFLRRERMKSWNYVWEGHCQKWYLTNRKQEGNGHLAPFWF